MKIDLDGPLVLVGAGFVVFASGLHLAIATAVKTGLCRKPRRA